VKPLKEERATRPIECRIGCGACCIAPSISSPLPGMPSGKKAGIRCPGLTDRNTCAVHGTAAYPRVCANFTPHAEMCGETFEHAMRYLETLERLTSGDPD
jgi:uncharacterized protein